MTGNMLYQIIFKIQFASNYFTYLVVILLSIIFFAKLPGYVLH